MSLQGKNILVGICGGIAAYKVPNLVRRLIKAGASVQTILTRSGESFVGKAALSTLTHRPVITELFPANQEISTEHISASDWADALFVVPATANTIGKFANGIADDFLSTLYLSVNTPILISPSMNVNMWNHPATQHNIEILKERGVTIVPPASGELACGISGTGRLPDDETLLFEIEKLLTPQDLAGIRILVTGGGTEEAIDSVRVITNKSSGKMGLALARNAQLRGGEVLFIHGQMAVLPPKNLNSVKINSAKEMQQAVSKEFKKCDILVMAAAVSDFTVLTPSTKKIKKQKEGISLHLVNTPDILKSIGKIKDKQKIIGFALEDAGHEKNGLQKLKEKKCDLLVYNTATALGSNTNKITIIRKDGSMKPFPELPKGDAAKAILDALLAL